MEKGKTSLSEGKQIDWVLAAANVEVVAANAPERIKVKSVLIVPIWVSCSTWPSRL